MATEYDLSEAFNGLRAAILTDEGFTDLLASNDAIYFAPPTVAVPSPLVEWIFRAWNPQAENSATGIYRPDLSMNIFAESPHLAWQIASYLEQHWSIPLARPVELATTNFRITQLKATTVISMGTVRLLNSLEEVHRVAMEWDLKINRK